MATASRSDATHAAVHDSQKLADLLDLSNTGNGVWADSAYRSWAARLCAPLGIVRARFKIGMMNLGYNIRRLVQLERMAAAPA